VRTQPGKPVAVAFLAVLAAGALVASAQQEWKTSVPFTYLIDYSQRHVNNPDYLKKISEAPPTLMHVGEDVVFSSVFGTKRVYGGPQRTRTEVITADEARQRMEELQKYTASMHAAGVKWIIPYINNLAILGDHVQRTGFWEFFDHWDRYREFGFGPRPTEDIVTAQMHAGIPRPRRLKGKDALDPDPNYPYKRYELCVNNPIWRNYLTVVTRNIAKTGMDGVFVDEMDLSDYCPYDQAGFREYVGRKYPGTERLRRFGSDNLETLRLGYPGQGALWYETQAYWSHSLGQFLRALRDEGRKVNPDFFVMSNLGPFAHIDGAFKRASGGKDPREWAPYSRLIMFEEMQRPGQLGPGVFFDNILQFKLAFGMGFTPGTLLYYAQEAPGIELSMAEAGAGGGGAFIQGGYLEPASRNKYRGFFEKHADLFEGYESHADVAVVYAYDEAYWGNAANLWAAHALSEYLSKRHILFDVIPPSQIEAARLASRYKVVITAGLWHMPDRSLAALHEFARRGGVWLNLADSGKFDDIGKVRIHQGPVSPSEKVGKGWILRRTDLGDVIPIPNFALYLLSESEANNLKEAEKLYQASKIPEYPFPPSHQKEDLQTLLEKSAGASLSVLPAEGLEGLRCNVWRRKESKEQVVTAHFVNYYSPIPTKADFVGGEFELGGPPEQYSPRVLEDVAVCLRLPPGRVTSVVAYDPDSAEPVAVEYQQTGNRVEFKLPPIRIYKIAKIAVTRNTRKP
jgi:hypothetical protein